MSDNQFTYRAGFVGRGKVLHVSNDRITACFDSFNGKSRRIDFATSYAATASQALSKAAAATGAKVCAVCERVAA